MNFFYGLIGKETAETEVPGKKSRRCQVGTISPTDMPDGSGQQLRVDIP